MKTVILSINSKYVHTLLSPRYLKANAVGQCVEIYETNVNVPLLKMISDVHHLSPDVIALPTYIFNVETVKRFISQIKLVLPNVIIILGGWEASFNVENFPEADYIMRGEGDFAFGKLLCDIQLGVKNERIIECGTVSDLSKIISPYDDDYARLGKEKILYIETSRGCPFSCSYCMSSATRTVRTFPLDRVFEDIKKVTSYSPKFVKFVDRTFNFNLKRANQILTHIIENYSSTSICFHFEVAPQLFDEELFNTIKRAKKGLFQFEIGVQTYNEASLFAIDRHANSFVIDDNIKRLISFENCHVHVDLIAGLPHEDLNSFARGFDRLISLKPNDLQLGFLKVLKGSEMQRAEGYKISPYPPYEIFSSPNMSFEDLSLLKEVEEVTEVFYNSGKFVRSIWFLIERYGSAFETFKAFAQFAKKVNGFNLSLSAYHKCDLLFDFAKTFINKDNWPVVEGLIESDFEIGGNCRKWHKVH